MYGEVGCESRPVGCLCTRRFRYQRPPRITVAIVRRPSVKPTTSGTVFVLLVEVTCCETVDNAVKLAVGVVESGAVESGVVKSGVDALFSRRILYDRRRVPERKSQLFPFIVSPV